MGPTVLTPTATPDTHTYCEEGWGVALPGGQRRHRARGGHPGGSRTSPGTRSCPTCPRRAVGSCTLGSAWTPPQLLSETRERDCQGTEHPLPNRCRSLEITLSKPFGNGARRCYLSLRLREVPSGTCSHRAGQWQSCSQTSASLTSAQVLGGLIP